jgi:hypothetical protein
MLKKRHCKCRLTGGMRIMKNKIFIIVVFVLFLYNNSNGQTLITNNKELYMKSQTENAELLKKSLEESLAADLKEVNEMKERMRKILASDLKEAYLLRDSIKKGIKPEGHKLENFFLQKEGKNIKLNYSLNKYEETNMFQDNLKDFARIVFIGGELSGYMKQEQNKITGISFNLNTITKQETAEDSPVERNSEFYPNGKLKRTMELKYKNYSRIVVVEEISHEVIIREDVIGIGYLYDNNGAIVEAFEYDYDDSLFEFTKENVMEYIKETYIKDENPDEYIIEIKKYPQHTVNGEIKKEAFWGISIMKRGDGRLIYMNLDCKTGEKLYESMKRIGKCPPLSGICNAAFLTL